MKVIKKNGEIEEYQPGKVRESMRNAGVSQKAINNVMKELENKIYDKILTTKLYKMVYKLVKKNENKYAASIYSLKQAIMNLGPSGYAFEDFISRIFEIMGYEIIYVRKKYKSMCIEHELDVVGKNFFAECKYHNKGGVTTGVKEAMYTHARFLDLKHASKHKKYNFKKAWIVTNTKLSGDAICYSQYWNLNSLSWKHPRENSISKIVDDNKLYPITIVPSISKNEFRKLSKNNIILVRELCEKTDKELKKIGIKYKKIKKIRDDCDKLMEI